MKRFWIVTVIGVAALLVPQAVFAATGSFSTSSSSTALTVSNGGSGKGIVATSKTGIAGYFVRSGAGVTPGLEGVTKGVGDTDETSTAGAVGVLGLATGTAGRTYGVMGRSASAVIDSSGVFGYSSAATGFTNGLFGFAVSDQGAGVYGTVAGQGAGVYGTAPGGTGVLGSSGTKPGDGTFGVASISDLLANAHIVTAPAPAALDDLATAVGDCAVGAMCVGNLAGVCEVRAQEASHQCTFVNKFHAGTVPIITITPKMDPGIGERFWVSDQDETGFTITMSTAPTGAIDFNYIVVGLAPASAAARAERPIR